MTETARTTGTPRSISQQQRKGALHRFADWLAEWHVTRIMMAVSAFAILLAVATFVIDIVGRTDERIARAWQLVTTKSPGNSGKIEALQYLNSENWWWPFKKQVPLFGVDLSTTTHGDQVFLQTVDLSGATLTGADLSGAILIHANLTSATLTDANLSGAVLVGANLSGAVLTGANLRDATLDVANLSGANLQYAILSDARMIGVNLSGATLPGSDLSDAAIEFANLSSADLGGSNMSGASLIYTNLSGANLGDAVGLTQMQLNKAWAWRLRPPEVLPYELTLRHLCEGTEADIRDFDFRRNTGSRVGKDSLGIAVSEPVPLSCNLRGLL